MKIRIWDITIRSTHLLYILGILALWWTGENRIFSLHIPIAFCLSGVLSFRIVWGFVGPETARFSAFLPTPRKITDYIRTIFHPNTQKKHHMGHNPLGALAVFAMLAAMTAQIVSGLFSVDTDGLNSGFLSSNISFDAGRDASDLHETGFNIIVILVALHVTAIAGYFFIKKQNLVRPMITGKIELDVTEAPAKDVRIHPVALIVSLMSAAAVTAALFYFQFG